MYIGAYMCHEQLSTVQTGRPRVMGDLMPQAFGFIKIIIDHLDHTYDIFVNLMVRSHEERIFY